MRNDIKSPENAKTYLQKRFVEEKKIIALQRNPPFPKLIMFELTNICNHTCDFCYSKDMKRRKKIIDVNLTEKLLKRANELGATEVGFSTTGEALANKKLFDYIKYAKELGFKYTFFSTNGALFNDFYINECFNSGLDSIKFSVNAGSRETYKKIHGKDEFNKVIEIIKNLHSEKIKRNSDLKIMATFVTTETNSNEQQALDNKINEYVDEILFVQQIELTGETNSGAVSLPCHYIFNKVHITAEGYLTACCVDYENNLIINDLNETDLLDAWNSKLYQAFRQRHLDKDIKGLLCDSCINRKVVKYGTLSETLNLKA